MHRLRRIRRACIILTISVGRLRSWHRKDEMVVCPNTIMVRIHDGHCYANHSPHPSRGLCRISGDMGQTVNSVLIMQTCNMSGNPFLSRRKVSAVSDSSPAQVALPFRSWQDQCRWWLCAASCNRPQVFTRWTRPWKQSLSCVDGTLRALLVQLGCFRLQGQGEIVLTTHAR